MDQSPCKLCDSASELTEKLARSHIGRSGDEGASLLLILVHGGSRIHEQPLPSSSVLTRKFSSYLINIYLGPCRRDRKSSEPHSPVAKNMLHSLNPVPCPLSPCLLKLYPGYTREQRSDVQRHARCGGRRRSRQGYVRVQRQVIPRRSTQQRKAPPQFLRFAVNPWGDTYYLSAGPEMRDHFFNGI